MNGQTIKGIPTLLIVFEPAADMLTSDESPLMK